MSVEHGKMSGPTVSCTRSSAVPVTSPDFTAIFTEGTTFTDNGKPDGVRRPYRGR